mmetsp:Transcript_14964/g.40088  ORF Transcript_14964/g.40088 Transcript_14964/m.40088 type:complete len:355 (-) Transcript_14964:133-1197(-)
MLPQKCHARSSSAYRPSPLALPLPAPSPARSLLFLLLVKLLFVRLEPGGALVVVVTVRLVEQQLVIVIHGLRHRLARWLSSGGLLLARLRRARRAHIAVLGNGGVRRRLIRLGRPQLVERRQQRERLVAALAAQQRDGRLAAAATARVRVGATLGNEDASRLAVQLRARQLQRRALLARAGRRHRAATRAQQQLADVRVPCGGRRVQRGGARGAADERRVGTGAQQRLEQRLVAGVRGCVQQALAETRRVGAINLGVAAPPARADRELVGRERRQLARRAREQRAAVEGVVERGGRKQRAPKRGGLVLRATHERALALAQLRRARERVGGALALGLERRPQVGRQRRERVVEQQ